MQVEDPNRPLPILTQEIKHVITTIKVITEEVEPLLYAVNVGKVTGPDVSPRLLRKCIEKLSGPLAAVFATCLR